jgi:hypothetical protein
MEAVRPDQAKGADPRISFDREVIKDEYRSKSNVYARVDPRSPEQPIKKNPQRTWE